MPYLSEVERGRKEASSEVLAAVCDALKVQLAEVLAEVGRDLSRDLAGAGARDQARIVGIEATRRRQAIAPPARRSGDVVLLAA